MTIKTILTPCDFSPTSMLAIEKACQLAEQLRAELHLVHVEEGESESDYQRVALDRLLAAVPPASELQNKVHRHVLSGRVQDSLLKYVNECNADLIVMGSRERSAVLPLAMGSVAQRILKNAPCPVMMVTQDKHNHQAAPDEATNSYLSLKTSDSPALDLLAGAISLRATDIHIDPMEHEQFGVRLRIDGSVISYCTMDQGVEARMTATPVAGGEAMALRLFSKENVFLPLEGLGFSDTGLEAVLRTLLRKDPDILFLGEIRDPESASIAMRAASSGRFDFSSLHTRDVASTITAFRDLGGTDHSLVTKFDREESPA